MGNEIFGKNGFTLDLLKTVDGVSIIQAQFEEEQNRRWREAQNISNRNERLLAAVEKAAENTDEIISHQKETIARQERYIKLLEKQISTQEEQLEAFNNLFASVEDGVLVEKEIMRLIYEEIDDKHPLWDFVKDKGGDILTAKILENWPLVWAGLKKIFVDNGPIRL